VDSLGVAVPVFLGSAVVVVVAGVFLALFGDEIADRTGWGALWVGTVLVSIATSLPELVTNISAVARENAPALALGNIWGADMINVFTVSIVALVFGVRNLYGGQTKDVEVLVLVAVGLGILGTVLGLTGDRALGWTSVGGLAMVAAYFAGMKLVYDAVAPGTAKVEAYDAIPDVTPPGNVKASFAGFGLASLVVIVAAPLLAASADGIAAATGLGRGFMGILAVSIVTTLPEASVTVTAARRRSYGLVLGNIFGSCAFNLSVIFYADLGNGPALLGSMDAEHFVAAGSAIGLMAACYLIIRSYKSSALAWAKHLVYVIPPAYVGTLFWVYVLSSG
jgi:cation:H+ antiporter